MQKRKTLLPTYLKGLSTGKYTLRQASESTGYSIRWLSKLKQDYLKNGLDILEHQNKNRIPANKTSQELKNKVIGIYADTYKDVNFKFFCECLADYHDIKISLPTLRNIMQEAEIKSPCARNCKKVKQVHLPRIRRANFGDLIQIDGTPYPWFYKFGDKKSYCIVGAIDDATDRITGLYMTEFECLYGYMEMLKQTCKYYDTKILDDIENVRGDTMPKVVENIIYRYMFAFGKERSA